MHRLKKEAILIYRPLAYALVIMLLAFQSYVIWEDRVNKISMVTYSYGTTSERNMDTAFVEEIKFTKDYINAIVLIQDKTKRHNVMIHSWQNIYKDRAAVIEWQTEIVGGKKDGKL